MASPLLPTAEVEAVVGRGTVIAMTPAHAQALERSRGYADIEPADIEPELAWEQWQIVRGY